MNQAIAENAWPGAVLLAAKDGNIFYQKVMDIISIRAEILCAPVIFLT